MNVFFGITAGSVVRACALSQYNLCAGELGACSDMVTLKLSYILKLLEPQIYVCVCVCVRARALRSGV